ncbi:hypothetical protein RND81_05G099100 [Saponaria officinalis]|uniref:F-box domain-containing protein n=1 Tax=Saponaria officinalis TaxID=3572 RepID=A0AAW1KWP8_SAPOF
MSEETKVQLKKMKSNILCDGQKLPHDLITMHILTRLPIKSVLEFKLVSKQWYSTLSSYHFGNAHFKFSSLTNPFTLEDFVFIQKGSQFYLFTYNEDGENKLFRLKHDFRETACCSKGNLGFIVELARGFGEIEYSAGDIGSIVTGRDKLFVIGSCNGLVCLGSLYDFILWNPVIGRSKKFDSDPDNMLNPSTICRASWGFGYVASIDDYKVVRIIELPLSLEIMVHVFSMKSNSWRRIDPREYDHVLSLRSFKSAVIISGQHYIFHTNRGVVCDERVNWIVAKAEVWGIRVVSFDMVNETFETYHNVELSTREVYWDKFLCVMRGCFSIYGANMRDDAYISMYKCPREGYQRKESIRLFRDLRLDSCTDLIDLSRDGKFLVQKDDAEIGMVDSSLRPMIYKRLIKFNETGRISSMYLTRHVPSLVTPDAEDSLFS